MLASLVQRPKEGLDRIFIPLFIIVTEEWNILQCLNFIQTPAEEFALESDRREHH